MSSGLKIADLPFCENSALSNRLIQVKGGEITIKSRMASRSYGYNAKRTTGYSVVRNGKDSEISASIDAAVGAGVAAAIGDKYAYTGVLTTAIV